MCYYIIIYCLLDVLNLDCVPALFIVCQKGCECLDGFVKLNNECVNITQCPCISGGVTYHEGDIIVQDCNTCTCHNQMWQCASDPCPSICSAVGDSHYNTFDSKEYSFDGVCDYVLVKSKQGQQPQFQVRKDTPIAVLFTGKSHNSRCC